MTNATVENNGSDNGLLDKFVDPALGCTPFTAPNPTNPNGSSASQALNELSARVNQKAPVALLPVNNPQLLVGGQFSVTKTNLYRIETDQPLLGFGANLDRNAASTARTWSTSPRPGSSWTRPWKPAPPRPSRTWATTWRPSWPPGCAGSFDNLNCKNYGLTNPVTLTTDANGVATAATYNTTPQKAQVNAARGGRNHRPNYRHRFMPGRFGHM